MSGTAHTLRTLRRLLLPCPWTKPALEAMEARSGCQRLVFLLGGAGTGKSSVIRQALLRSPPWRDERVLKWCRPIAVVPVPCFPDMVELGRAIVSNLGDPASCGDKTRLGDMVRHVRTQVEGQGVQALVFDDAHHLLQSRGKARVTMLRLLSEALSDMPVDVVFVGDTTDTPNLANCFEGGERRVDRVILSDCPWDGDQGTDDWIAFLDQIDDALTIPSSIRLGSEEIAFRLHAGTDGNHGRLFQLLGHFAASSADAGPDGLSAAHLSAAWQRLPLKASLDPFARVTPPSANRRAAETRGPRTPVDLPASSDGCLPQLPVSYSAESPLGYLARVAEANGYGGIDPLLALAGLRGYSFAKGGEDGCRKLTALLGERGTDLAHLLYRPIGEGQAAFLGHPTPPHYVSVGWQWLCPACLKDSAYHHALWDASFISVRWSPFPGQFRGWDKLGSGPCHAANLIPTGAPWWASAGVRPPSAECGRSAL